MENELRIKQRKMWKFIYSEKDGDWKGIKDMAADEHQNIIQKNSCTACRI